MTRSEGAQLMIRLAPGVVYPLWRRSCLNDYCGDPETLLEWIETQLGLPMVRIHQASRVSEFAAALDAAKHPLFAESLKADRWATASELLSRREELVLSGWDEVDSEAHPVLVRALARVVAGRPFQFPGEAERLKRVLDALDGGQVLPPHRCLLHDRKEAWPTVWQKVLARMNVAGAPDQIAHAPKDSALQRAQSFLLGGAMTEVGPDATFRHVRTRSEAAAVEFIAAALAKSPDKLSTTVVCCEDDELALRLDACLSRIGLPTTGASAWSRAHPVLQVLPLSLALGWTPVDPQVLLGFLTLPVLPIPRKATFKLANALTREPGLGSGEWDQAVADLCSEESDPKGELRERLDVWFHCDRTPRGSDMASRLIRTRCALVARWAAGRAALLEQDAEAPPGLIEALHAAAGQAALLGELAECQGASLSESQLARLLEEALANGAETNPFIEAEGGPIRVRSLSEIDGPCDRLIWLGPGTEDTAGCRWSSGQLRELRAAGVLMDDGSKVLSSLRSAETRGFCHVKESFLTVVLPQDLEKRWHPLWLAVRGLLPKPETEHPLVLEDLVMTGDATALAPFGFEHHDVVIEPPQKARPLWNIPANLLSDRDTVSASELHDRLACPLKWTLHYPAKIRPGSMAELPDDHQLKGTFCHSIFERVFGGGAELPALDAAVAQALAVFDERLPLDAAPLAQPNKYLERQRLRSQIENATRVFVSTLASGGYRIVGIEVALAGNAFGKPLNGWIDCVAKRNNGEEAIIDFKYGGRSKYHALIAEGRAVQLASYAYGRSTAGGAFPAVAYLVLSDGLLFTPSGSAVHGTAQHASINAPAIQTVWQKFSDAVEAAGDWLRSGAPVPARPLQDSSEWPAGATIVLKEEPKADEEQEVCRYCDFTRICGLEETT
jgi:ATP-dependent helicase/nuclease subunit B